MMTWLRRLGSLAWLAFAASVCGQTPAPPPSPPADWLGVWAADLPGYGNVVVQVTAPDPNKPLQAEVWWLFGEVMSPTAITRLKESGAPRIEGDLLFVDRLDFAQTNAVPGLAFRLAGPGEMKLAAYGVFDAALPPIWAGLVLRKDPTRKAWFDRSTNSLKLADPLKRKENRGWKPLPASWPADIVMPTALLFSSNSILLGLSLQASDLPPDFIRRICAMVTDKSAWNTHSAETALHALARNPRTPTDVLEQIWSRPADLSGWYLVAEHPNARPEWRETLVERVMQGNSSLRSSAARMDGGPPELFRRLVADGPDTRRALAENPDAPTFVYEMLARDYAAEIGDTLAHRTSAPPAVLDSLVDGASRERKYSLLANTSLRPETRTQLLRELVETATVKDHRRLAAKDGVPAEFLAKCATDPDPYVRIFVAGNPGTDEATLRKLAADDSVTVVRHAREQLQKRFPDAVPPAAASPLPPPSLADIGPSVTEQFRRAVVAGDLEKMRTLADYQRGRGHLVACLKETAAQATAQYRPEIMDFYLANGFVDDGDYALTRLAGATARDSRWLAYFKARGVFAGKSAGEAYIGALYLGTNADLAALLAAGLEPNLRNFQYRPALHSAVIVRNPAAVEILLKAGASVTLTDSEKKTALDWAVRLMQPAAIRLLDKDGVYRERLDAFARAFPPAPDSRFVGSWVTYPGQPPLALSLFPDGIGRLHAMLHDNAVLGWRPEGPDGAVGAEVGKDGSFAAVPTYRWQAKGNEIDFFMPGEPQPYRLKRGAAKGD